MFSHLVESDHHTGELKRRGTFFIVTMAAYALVLMLMSVAGVYAYEAHIDDQQLELVALVPPDTEEPKPPTEPNTPRPPSPAPPANNGGSRNAGGPPQPLPSNTSSDPTKTSGPPQVSTSQLPPTVPDGGNNRAMGIGPGTYNPIGDGTESSSNGKGNPNGKPLTEEPPPLVKKSEPPPKQRIAYIGPVNSRALQLPQPSYPAVAKVAGIQGAVNVEILIDEQGRVISAHATSGHVFLRAESEKAAMRARFSPTLLQDQPVKAKGVITFNFILNK
ncbi:MAG TPA: TonB family protein [Pyrinomonadaceae bacterium]|nr:TonB family protein [Pyrinomonadaceae bacterium]